MEATIYGVYEETNKSVEGKLQELLEVLGRISKLVSFAILLHVCSTLFYLI